MPESPGFLHAIPALNILTLLLVFFLLGPSFVSQSGVAVDLPVSPFQIEPQAGATVVSVEAGDPPQLWLEREAVSFSQLSAKLDARRGADSAAGMTLLLRVDRRVAVNVQMEVAQMASMKGYHVLLVGDPVDEASKGER